MVTTDRPGAARACSDPAPRAGPDTSPGYRPLGAQGDARDFRAATCGGGEGWSPRRADPTACLGPSPELTSTRDTKSTATRAAASQTLRRELPGREAGAARHAAAADRLRWDRRGSRTAHASRGRAPLALHTLGSAEEARDPSARRLRVSASGPRGAQTQRRGPAQSGRRARAPAPPRPRARRPARPGPDAARAPPGACPQAPPPHPPLTPGERLRMRGVGGAESRGRGGNGRAPGGTWHARAPPLASRPGSLRAPASSPSQTG